MHPRLSSAALAALVTSAGTTLAASPQEEPTVVVTATRQASRTNELLSDVTVIGRDEIEQAGVMTLPEFLAARPGIQFTENGGAGANASLFLRGSNSGHTLLLIDGLRVSSATLGSVTWSRLPLDQIERIEILRGPASSLYGADAIGGVVQIFTRRGDGPARISAEAGFGNRGTARLGAGVSGSQGQLRYSLAASEFRTDGFSNLRPSAGGFNPDADGFDSDNLSASLAYGLAEGHEVGLQVFRSAGTNDYDSGYNPASAASDYEDETRVQSQAVYLKNRLAAGWTSTLRVGRSTDDSTNTADGTLVSKFRTDQDQYSWQHDLRLPVGSLLLGWERLEQKVGGTSDFSVTERRIDSWLAGWTGRFGSHRLQANLRQDDNSQFGDKTTGALAWGYQLDDAWRLQTAYGTAFKAPSFNDLYYPRFYDYVGNPDLKPEFARNREAAVHYEHGGHHASATWYLNKVEDLISWSGVTSPVNVGKARLEGLTLAYQGRLWGYDVDASLDYLDAEDSATGRRLARRAREDAKAGLGRSLGPWAWRVEWRAAGHRYDDDTNSRRLGGYGLVNLQASYAIDRDWSLFGRVNNLFDKDYELVANYATGGTSVFVGVRYAPQ